MGRSAMSRSAPMLATGLLCLGLVGCALAAGSRPPTTYDLVAPRSFSAAKRPAPWQLVVYEPSAVHALETDRLMIETVQKSGAVKAVSASAGQYALATELRAFQIDVSSGRAAAEIDIFARLINISTGKVVATKGFSARVPATSDSPGDAIAALNQAFTEVLQDTTTWVASRRG
jgi:cholesterol transport system auxiliary component